MKQTDNHSMALSYRATGVVLFALAAFLMWEALKLQYYTPVGPGAGFFPVWLAGGLGTLAIIMVARTFLPTQEMVDREEYVPSKFGLLRIAAVVAAMVLFVLFLQTLGFRLAIFLLVLGLMFVFGRPSIVVCMAVAICTSLGIYYVFSSLLDIPLPTGALGF